MEVVRKKNCVIVILDEKNFERNLNVDEIEINSTTFSFRTSGNWITMPLNRLIKVKESLRGGSDDRD